MIAAQKAARGARQVAPPVWSGLVRLSAIQMPCLLPSWRATTYFLFPSHLRFCFNATIKPSTLMYALFLPLGSVALLRQHTTPYIHTRSRPPPPQAKHHRTLLPHTHTNRPSTDRHTQHTQTHKIHKQIETHTHPSPCTARAAPLAGGTSAHPPFPPSFSRSLLHTHTHIHPSLTA